MRTCSFLWVWCGTDSGGFGWWVLDVLWRVFCGGWGLGALVSCVWFSGIWILWCWWVMLLVLRVLGLCVCGVWIGCYGLILGFDCVLSDRFFGVVCVFVLL